MSLTIEEFDKMGDALAELREKIDFMKAEMKPLQEHYDGLESKIMKILQEQNKTSYRFSRIQVVISQRTSVQTPKTEEDKRAFFGWLRESKGENVMWHYMSVNSQSLNAFYREEFETALEANNIDFKVPGVGKETITPILSVRRIG